MSLINQMLKDLETRSHPPISHETVLPTLKSVLPNSVKRAKYWLVLTSCAAFLASVMIVKYFANYYAHNMLISRINIRLPTVTAIKETHVNTLIPITGARLSGITLQIEKNTTSLRLLLNQRALYRVNNNLKNKTFDIILDQTQLVTSLPPIHYANSAIQNIKMINLPNGDLKIRLILKEGAELNYLSLNDVISAPEVQVDFTTKALPETQKPTTLTLQTGAINKIVVDLTIDEQYQNALALATHGQQDKAILLLTALITKSPIYMPAYESLATMYLQQGNQSKAKQIIQLGLTRQPFYSSLVAMKARMWINEGKFALAMNLLQAAPPELKQNPDYHALIAVIYQHEGKPELAARLYEQLLTLEPNNGAWWAGLGIAMDSLGRENLAQQALSRAYNNDNINPELKAYIGTLLSGTRGNPS